MMSPPSHPSRLVGGGILSCGCSLHIVQKLVCVCVCVCVCVYVCVCGVCVWCVCVWGGRELEWEGGREGELEWEGRNVFPLVQELLLSSP